MEKQPTAFMCEVREERARTTRYRKHTRAFSCPSDCLLVLLTLLLLSTCCVYIFSSSPSVSARHARSRSLYSLAIFWHRTLWNGPTFCTPAYDLKFSSSSSRITSRARFSPSSLISLSLPSLLSSSSSSSSSFVSPVFAVFFPQRSSRSLVVCCSRLQTKGSTLLGFSVVIGFCVLEEEASNVESDALCARWSDAALDDDDDDDDDGISCQRCLSVSDAERGAYRRSGCTRWSAE